MNLSWYISLMALGVLIVKNTAENCYDWDGALQELLKLCEKCKPKSTDKKEYLQCFKDEKKADKKDSMLDAEGNVIPAEYIKSLLTSFTGTEEKRKSITNGLNDCLKEKVKTQEEMQKLGNCTGEVFKTGCPKLIENLKKWGDNEDFKKCVEPMRQKRSLWGLVSNLL